MGSLNRKLYVDNKNGLNLEYTITIKSAQTLLGEWRFSLFLPNLLTPAGNFRRFKNCHFRSTSLKLGSLNRKLFINFKNGLNFYYTIINKSVDPYSLFFKHPVYVDWKIIDQTKVINISFYMIYLKTSPKNRISLMMNILLID